MTIYTGWSMQNKLRLLVGLLVAFHVFFTTSAIKLYHDDHGRLERLRVIADTMIKSKDTSYIIKESLSIYESYIAEFTHPFWPGAILFLCTTPALTLLSLLYMKYKYSLPVSNKYHLLNGAVLLATFVYFYISIGV